MLRALSFRLATVLTALWWVRCGWCGVVGVVVGVVVVGVFALIYMRAMGFVNSI